MRSEQSSGFPFHLLLAFLRHGIMNGIDSQARVRVGREDLLGRLALADGKAKHLHLAIEASHTTDPAKSKTLGKKHKERKL